MDKKRHTPEKHTEETKLKISRALKGKKKSAETKEKMRQAQIGHKLSEETKRQMSEKMKKSRRVLPIRKGKDCNLWRGGISFEPYSTDWTETLKRAIRERDNYICQLCSQYGNEVHHKDYNKKNCNPDNLITLCHSCHNKTNFNRDYWRNYFNNGKEFR